MIALQSLVVVGPLSARVDSLVVVGPLSALAGGMSPEGVQADVGVTVSPTHLTSTGDLCSHTHRHRNVNISVNLYIMHSIVRYPAIGSLDD